MNPMNEAMLSWNLPSKLYFLILFLCWFGAQTKKVWVAYLYVLPHGLHQNIAKVQDAEVQPSAAST